MIQRPSKPLPFPAPHESADEYISALLAYITSSELLQILCGGVHILDFLTLEPDLYTSLLPEDWRIWFAKAPIHDLLDLLMREDIELLLKLPLDVAQDADSKRSVEAPTYKWRSIALPPRSLLIFIKEIRELLLDRSYQPPDGKEPADLGRTMSVGMNAKKAHEVAHFAAFVASFTDKLSQETVSEPLAPYSASSNSPSHAKATHRISHLVDFGSGQNYLGRILAGPMYEKNVIALESKKDNVVAAQKMDVHAKMAKKKIIWRNKKKFREEGIDDAEEKRQARLNDLGFNKSLNTADDELKTDGFTEETREQDRKWGQKVSDQVHARITYFEHIIKDGDLSDVAIKTKTILQDQLTGSAKSTDINDGKTEIGEPELMVISLHSCGNLLHHGLRSLVMNPSVKAVAMIGCCYNLCTERLGPPAYKLKNLRSKSQRLVITSMTRDPHGFPMSERFVNYKHDRGEGIRMNITARMMAVQAPSNWTASDCDSFFTRHFYRALIQRIFLDKGFVNPPTAADDVVGGTVRGWAGGTEPIIIGGMSKSTYKTFVSYVRGALAKLYQNSEQGEFLKQCMQGLSDEEIAGYEHKYAHKKHELCVVWSLMSFAAGIMECTIIADRWQYLKEQNEVADAWVQTVFSYEASPRNLAIVAVKR
jgi:hypothetical protein